MLRAVHRRHREFEIYGKPVRTTVVEERQFRDGELTERAFSYYAQSDHGAVYSFGKDVDRYKQERVVGHDGSWQYGRDTKALGAVMPAEPKVGQEWRSESAPGTAITDRRVEKKLHRIPAPAGDREDAIEMRDRHPEPDEPDSVILYSRGAGAIRITEGDRTLELSRCWAKGGPLVKSQYIDFKGLDERTVRIATFARSGLKPAAVLVRFSPGEVLVTMLLRQPRGQYVPGLKPVCAEFRLPEPFDDRPLENDAPGPYNPYDQPTGALTKLMTRGGPDCPRVPTRPA
jgi:hypothetical protein